jgi:hypothetical protein
LEVIKPRPPLITAPSLIAAKFFKAMTFLYLELGPDLSKFSPGALADDAKDLTSLGTGLIIAKKRRERSR